MNASMLTRSGHLPRTNCQIDLGLGITTAGQAAYMLIWPRENAPEMLWNALERIQHLVDDYLKEEPDGTVIVGPGTGIPYIKLGAAYERFPGTYCLTDDEVTIRGASATVLCRCNGAAEQTVLWQV